MNINTLINTDLPNLYKFLTLCIIEQRGIHSLVNFDKNAKVGSIEDINFIHKYIHLVKSFSKEKDFLEEFDTMVNNNLMVHITRDCQVIETGSHYVTLTFKTKKENSISSIGFRSKFKQDFDAIPVGNNKITIIYLKDLIIPNIEDKECYNYGNTVIDQNNIKYYRKYLYNNEISVYKNMISELPCEYLIPQNYILKPKLKPDACILS